MLHGRESPGVRSHLHDCSTQSAAQTYLNDFDLRIPWTRTESAHDRKDGYACQRTGGGFYVSPRAVYNISMSLLGKAEIVYDR